MTAGVLLSRSEETPERRIPLPASEWLRSSGRVKSAPVVDGEVGCRGTP